MKRIKWNLLAIALLGVVLAYANKPVTSYALHRYAYMCRSTDGTRWYISKDLTSAGWIKGLDYDCIYPPSVCTFLANPMYIHMDLTGTYFYHSDIPVSGVDNSGIFVNLSL